jgi:DNA-binding CsgD family transcriptional regulator
MMLLAQPDPSHEGTRWLRDLLRLAMQATRISCATFYWIDDRQRMIFAASEGIGADRLELYQDEFQSHDPCRPGRMMARNEQVQTLQGACRLSQDRDVERYRPFMALSGIKDAMDLLFWHDGRPIGGLGILSKGEDATFAPETIQLARSLRSYVEASLAYHPHVRRSSARRRMESRYALSRRELEVAEMIGQGLTNQDISDELDIALPTVKTHVQSLFRKVGVANRTSLMTALELPSSRGAARVKRDGLCAD